MCLLSMVCGRLPFDWKKDVDDAVHRIGTF